MSKILKIKIGRNQTGSGTSYIYPPEYDSSKINVLSYESIVKENEDIIKVRGNKEEYIIGVVKDVDAPGFLVSADIVELNQTEAETTGNLWRPQVTKIEDRDKVIQILAKVALNQDLTQTEKDAINPDKEEPGIGKSRSFAAMLSEAKANVDS